MTPELVFILRIVLLSAALLGLELLLERRLQFQRAQPQRFVQPNPVVRLSGPKILAVRLSTVQASSAPVTQLPTTIVRLEPLPRTTDYITEKRAA